MVNRILIVGFGSIGRRHLDLARALHPQAEIAILRHQNHSIIPEGADHVFSNMSEALLFSPKLAVISNPATFHLSSAIPLAEAGVHLFIEKPLSTSSEGVKDLIEACKKTNVVLCVGYNLRFLKSLQKFKTMLDNQIIGKVWSVRSEIGQYLPSWRPNSDYRKSVSAQHLLGGGALLELSHEIDYLRWIFGEVDWVQAILTQQSDLEINVEDTAHLVLGFCADSNERPLVGSVDLDFIRQDTVRLCTSIGKLGSLRWNGVAGTVELWAAGKSGWQEIYKDQPTRDVSYAAEWQDMISCIEQGAKPMITGEDGLKVMQIIDSARLSSNIKSRVKIGSANEL